MLKAIRENPDRVRQNIKNKNESVNIEPIIELDEKRRSIIQEVEKLKNLRNVVSNEISLLKKNKENADEKINAMKQVSDSIKSLDEELRQIEDELNELVLYIPNFAHESVPVGKTPEDNPVIRTWGEPKEQKLKMDHMEISKKLGIIDFERAAKLSGSGFACYNGKGATLERALINFFLDFHTKNHGFREIMTPFIVNTGAMVGTGQIPKLKDDMYYVKDDDFYLIPTAEVPITNFRSGEVLKLEEMPVKYCGYSPCFRREAGSYGKETRGLLRVHQFNKVELVKICTPETSYDELEMLVKDVENVLQALKLTYRVILLCTGDTSFSSAKTYDLEVWSPAEQKWLEVSSCSNFENFQAKRANIRYKPTPSSKPEYVHTLNGSGLATPRIMVALLENYLEEDGRIKIPEVLRTYCGFDYI
ncbi:MAG: serine--tRNA ligase [FCB group bacterium]|jgi:seryl-tRNA synthetase